MNDKNKHLNQGTSLPNSLPSSSLSSSFQQNPNQPPQQHPAQQEINFTGWTPAQIQEFYSKWQNYYQLQMEMYSKNAENGNGNVQKNKNYFADESMIHRASGSGAAGIGSDSGPIGYAAGTSNYTSTPTQKYATSSSMMASAQAQLYAKNVNDNQPNHGPSYSSYSAVASSTGNTGIGSTNTTTTTAAVKTNATKTGSAKNTPKSQKTQITDSHHTFKSKPQPHQQQSYANVLKKPSNTFVPAQHTNSTSYNPFNKPHVAQRKFLKTKCILIMHYTRQRNDCTGSG